MKEERMRFAVVVALTLALIGCGKPDITMGPGTIQQLDGNLTYTQDNHWVFATERSFVHAKTLEGTHCDRLDLFGDDYITRVVGTNCINPTATALDDLSTTANCMMVTDHGYVNVDCQTGKPK
jgi:hypothetical protein